MAQTLLELVADLELSLASAVSVGATTATLSSASDGDGVALPAGKYGFTIDSDNSAKEFIICDLNGTALTNVLSITKQGASSSGFTNYHRIGATVTITDWAILSRMLNNLDGTTGFNSATPIKYDAEPSYADPLTIPTVQYVLDTVNGGVVTFNRQIISGDAGENISAGDWVYLNTTDGEWYKTDADDTAKCLGVQIGKAIGAGTDGLPIDGGIFISGTETVGTYVAGTTYYISNTAGELSTSAGTNSVVVGVGDANGDLVLRKATPSQVDAMQGGGDLGTPDTGNKFITEDYFTAKAAQKVTFNSSGTWTKDAGLVRVLVQVWGAGGSGARTNQAATETSGGGGGAFLEGWFEASQLGATETVTIGAGGAAVSINANGNVGGSSSFGSLLIANGGAGGIEGGSDVAGAAGGTNGAGIALPTPLFGAGGANTGTAGVTGLYCGGSGGVANGATGNSGGSLYGGAAGGSAGPAGVGSAGVSIFGGNGGAASNAASGNATAGTQPGGGGGAKYNSGGTGNSGAGGDGRVVVYEFYV